MEKMMYRAKSQIAIKPTSTKKTNVFEDVAKGKNLADNQLKDLNIDTRKRRSRLGTRGTRLSVNPLNIKLESSEEKEESTEDQNQQRNFDLMDDISDDNSSCSFKKSLFKDSPVSKRLNMDSLESDNSPRAVYSFPVKQKPPSEIDVDVTGIDFINDPCSLRKTQTNNIHNRKSLLTNGSQELLKFNSKVWDQKNIVLQPRKSIFFKSSNSSAGTAGGSSSWFPETVINKTPTPPDFLRNITSRTSRYSVVKTPSPPPCLSRNKTESQLYRSISTPELPKLSFLDDYNKRYRNVNNNDNINREDNLSGTNRSVTSRYSHTNNDSSNAVDQLGFTLKNVRLNYENKPNYLNDIKDNVLCDEKNTLKKQVSTFEESNSVLKTHVELSANNADFGNDKNRSMLSYDLNNSLEVLKAHSNNTYVISDKKNSTITLSTINDHTLSSDNFNQGNSVQKSPTVLCDEPSKVDLNRSPSFISFNKCVNATYELDNLMDSFVNNELCVYSDSKSDTSLDRTLVENSNKKRLSVVFEESEQASTVTKEQRNKEKRVSMKNISNSHQDSFQIASVNKTLVNDKSASIRSVVTKMCDLVKCFENLKYEHDLFTRQYEEFKRKQDRNFSLVITAFNDQKNELVNLMEDKENNLNDSVDRDLVNQISTVTKKLMDSKNAPKTPDCTKQTSKSVYSQLKTDYTCLKTPKLSTVKKKTESSRKVFTPHSMSICIQDQLEQLFDD